MFYFCQANINEFTWHDIIIGIKSNSENLPSNELKILNFILAKKLSPD